jgi:hypothetical protein
MGLFLVRQITKIIAIAQKNNGIEDGLCLNEAKSKKMNPVAIQCNRVLNP